MIGIVDYGLGNVAAILTIYKRLNIAASLVSTPEALARATRIVLPGVGAFDWAMHRLNQSGLRAMLDEQVAERGKPVLGICVGMQMMGRRSDEGEAEGLAWIDGEVRRFSHDGIRAGMQLPHMGWNDVHASGGESLFIGLESDARFYFLHSYYFVPREKQHVVAVADYGGRYACSIRAGNVYGVQFHPEKSHQWGVQLLKNFAEV